MDVGEGHRVQEVNLIAWCMSDTCSITRNHILSFWILLNWKVISVCCLLYLVFFKQVNVTRSFSIYFNWCLYKRILINNKSIYILINKSLYIWLIYLFELSYYLSFTNLCLFSLFLFVSLKNYIFIYTNRLFSITST